MKNGPGKYRVPDQSRRPPRSALGRLWQGVATTLVNGPAMALMLAHSADVAEDMGVLESVSGLAYMVGPAAGGALYASLGFASAFYVLALAHLAALAAVPIALRGLQVFQGF